MPLQFVVSSIIQKTWRS